MLNLGGGSDGWRTGCDQFGPEGPALRTQLAPVIDSSSNVSSIVLASSKCYYSGNCQLAAYSGLRGDPYFDMDARLAKNIKLGERRNLQLIFQAFNLFNHANYGNNFGFTTNELTVATPPLSNLQEVSAADSTFSNPVGFINPSSSTLPRAFTAEFGARFSF